jgi:8-oxo-dGTP pyrophosphatase MutT (NUDIX family)
MNNIGVGDSIKRVRYEYDGIEVTTENSNLESKIPAIVESIKFKNWVNGIDRTLIGIDTLKVTDVDFFGPVHPSKLGFLKGVGNAIDLSTGKPMVANIALIRGKSIAVLIIVKIRETGEKKIILCEQLRFPIGRMAIEACAGMVDDKVSDADILGVAFQELKEEAGFNVRPGDLVYLGEIMTSPGLLDEMVRLFFWETTISQEEFEEKQKGVFGDDSEKIHLKMVDFENFGETLDQIGDVKAECAWRRYCDYKKRKADIVDTGSVF